MKILITGCAGYIGASFTKQALDKGFNIFGVDNFTNSSDAYIKYFENTYDNFLFKNIDLCKDFNGLKKIINEFEPDTVIHFAGLKSVSESERAPLKYWNNNVVGCMNLLKSIESKNINFIFSSSATVYGNSDIQPVKESLPLSSISSYGSTKIAQNQWSLILWMLIKYQLYH